MELAPHPFTLRQLQYAVAVADALSFRRAAERCHVSQPSLSAQLLQLESALGVKLFERSRKRVLPTAAGEALIARARELLLSANDLASTARQLGDPLTGTVKLGVIPTISPYLLPAIAPALRKKYPRLTIVWVEDKTSVLIERLDAGAIDGAILALEADIGDVEREVIAADRFVLALPKNHPLAARDTPAKAADLAAENVLLLDEGHCMRQQALTFCSKAKAEELGFRATSLSTLAQMVAGGAGVTLLPELAVPTEAARAKLATRALAQPAPQRTIALVWRKRSPLAGVMKTLAGTVRDAYPKHYKAA